MNIITDINEIISQNFRNFFLNWKLEKQVAVEMMDTVTDTQKTHTIIGGKEKSGPDRREKQKKRMKNHQ